MPADIEAASRAMRVDETLGVKLVFAMIEPAAADGKIDDEEMRGPAGFDRVRRFAPPNENSKLTAALNQPPSVEDIQALAESPEQASELCAASLAAIDLDTAAEDMYLRRLARSLKLEPSLVKQLHSEASSLPERAKHRPLQARRPRFGGLRGSECIKGQGLAKRSCRSD